PTHCCSGSAYFLALLDRIKYFGALFHDCACAHRQTGAHMGDGAVAADLCACADHHILSQDAALDHGAGLDHDAVHQDRVLHGSAVLDHDARRQHRVLDAAIDAAALGDEGVLDHGAGADLL